MLGALVAILLVAMASFTTALMADSRLSLQCKNIARDVIINSCKGPRYKRSATLNELEKTFLISRLLKSPVIKADGLQSSRQRWQVYYIQPRSIVEFQYEDKHTEQNSFYESERPGSLLGFSLTSDELEELYEEIGDRMPRNSKDLNKKIFQHVASICCSNAKLCYDNPSVIPCMGY